MENAIRRNEGVELMDKYYYETERLLSFEGCQLTVITAEELAAEGFYWDYENLVACAFCCGRLLLRNIDVEGVSVREKHIKTFPNCSFGSGGVNPNIPLRECRILEKLLSDEHKTRLLEVEDEYPNTDHDFWRQQEYWRDSNYLKLKRFGLEEYWNPKRKSLFNSASRLRTFDNWPKTNTQNPSKLAKAGFYYFNINDDVRCFYCDVGIRNWGAKEKPFVEHARWSPDCIFLLLRKGVKFVRKTLKKNPPYLPTTSKIASLLDWAKNRTTTFTKEEFECLLDLPILKELLRLDWSEEVVIEAFMSKLGRTGHPFQSLKSAIQEVTMLADEKLPDLPCQTNIPGERGYLDESYASSDEESNFPNLNVRYKETNNRLSSKSEHGHRLPPPKEADEYFFPNGKQNNFNFQQLSEEDRPNYPLRVSSSESIFDYDKGPDNPFPPVCSPVESTASWFSMASLTIASNYNTEKREMYYNEDEMTWEEERETYMKCKNCYKRTSDTILLPCMHMVACYKCAIRLQSCPSCEVSISSISSSNTY